MNLNYKKFILDYKKVALLTAFLFIFFCCLMSVSATDYTVSGNSFDDVASAVSGSNSGDNILLGNKTYTAGSNSNITIITDNVAIKGASSSSKARLNGQGTGSTIMIIRANNVRLENLVFENADVYDYAGAIWSRNLNLTIVNCEFHNNRAVNGPIFLDNGSDNTIILDCIFTNNTAAYFKLNGSGGGGGAIDTHSSHAQIINCRFTNNSAIGSGGAIVFMFGTNNTVSGCTFTNNNAPNGGAIATSPSGTTLKIINTNFNNNKATNNGGAIYSLNSLTVSNSNFTSNTANNGGALYSTKTLTMSNNNLVSNSASNGGAIYSTSNLNINNNIFKTNSASNGGAIRATASTTIKGSTFSLNKATSTGGAIYTTSSLSLDNSKFSDNTAVNGGGIYSSNTLTLTSTSGTNNKATTGNGGFIYGIGTININGGTFSGNNAKYNGGAVYGTGTTNIKSNAKFNSNTAINGGAIFSNNNLNIMSSNFTTNKATNGGAIYSTNLAVDKGIFSFNQATKDGGAIYANKIDNISGSQFLNNIADKGGAISVFKSFKITSTIFSNNKCGLNFKIELLADYIRYGSSKLKVTVSRKDNVKLGNGEYSIYYDGNDSSYINNKKIFKATGLNTLSINVNGVINKTKNGVATFKVGTNPNYDWKDFTFTANYGGDSKFKSASGSLKVRAKIVKTEAYNMEKNSKGKTSKKYYFPYRKDEIQTIYNGKTYTKTNGQYTSHDIYFLGGEKVPTHLKKYLEAKDKVCEVNNSKLKNRIIDILKSKSYKVSGLITPLKKAKAIYKWVGMKTNYHSGYNFGAVKVHKRICDYPKGEHANCVGYANILTAMLRTAGIPTAYHLIEIDIVYYKKKFNKTLSSKHHTYSYAYILENGKWKEYKADATGYKIGWKFGYLDWGKIISTEKCQFNDTWKVR